MGFASTGYCSNYCCLGGEFNRLTSAIQTGTFIWVQVMADEGRAEFKAYDAIDKAPSLRTTVGRGANRLPSARNMTNQT